MKEKRRLTINWPTYGFIKKKAIRLISHPVFPLLTVFGNLLIAFGALGLYYLEKDHNPNIHSLLDTLWWAISTVTTVGYGDVSPITPTGKVVGIILMIIGTALFWSYTALFADALISEELEDFESEMRSIEKKLRALTKTENKNPQASKDTLTNIEKHLAELKT
ncbi:MAG: potassium channel family protein [Bdellovibrionota bacterium]